MKPWTRTQLMVGCLALLSSAPALAETSFVRVTNSFMSPDGSSVSVPTYGMRPVLSSDGTKVLYAIDSVKNDVYRQTVQMDRLSLANTPTLIKDSHIEFPTGGPSGDDSYIATQPSMSSDGSIVGISSVYRPKPDSDFRDNIRVFAVAATGAPSLIFEKKDLDSVNAIRVSANGKYVAYTTVKYLEYSGESSFFVYDVQAKTEKRVNVPAALVEGAMSVRDISNDGVRLLVGSSYESETAGDNILVLNTATGKQVPITTVQDSQFGPTSSSWDANGVMSAFAASAPLSKGDTNRALDVYVASTTNPAGSMLRVSSLGAKQGNYSSGQPQMSKNGQFVAFISRADNLRPNDVNYAKDLYLYGLRQGALVGYVSGNDDINYPTVSDSGATVAFVSGATNFVAADNNKASDIFVGRPVSLQAQAK
jgi:hypothetical protein